MDGQCILSALNIQCDATCVNSILAGGEGQRLKKSPHLADIHTGGQPARGSVTWAVEVQSLLLSSYQAECRNKCKFAICQPRTVTQVFHDFKRIGDKGIKFESSGFPCSLLYVSA